MASVRIKKLFRKTAYQQLGKVRILRYKFFTDIIVYVMAALLILLLIDIHSLSNSERSNDNLIWSNVIFASLLALLILAKFRMAGRIIAVSNSRKIMIRGFCGNKTLPKNDIWDMGMPSQPLTIVYKKPLYLKFILSVDYNLTGTSYELGKVLSRQPR